MNIYWRQKHIRKYNVSRAIDGICTYISIYANVDIFSDFESRVEKQGEGSDQRRFKNRKCKHKFRRRFVVIFRRSLSQSLS